jgi:anti-sigma regulatory factor (Ser/Thr protein kinase)
MAPEPNHEAAIEIPAEPAYVATARMFGTALARHFGVAEPTIEDLKLAISEACAVFIRGAPSDGPVLVRAEADGARLRFRVSGAALVLERTGDDTPTPSTLPAVLGMELILALFADAELSTDGGETGITFSMPVEA